MSKTHVTESDRPNSLDGGEDREDAGMGGLASAAASRTPPSIEHVVAAVESCAGEGDLHTAEIAARMAADRRASLTLVYAVTPVVFPSAGTEGMAQQEEYERAHEHLTGIARSVASRRLDPGVAIRVGTPHEALEAEAEECGADVIVARARRTPPWRSRFANRSLRRIAGTVPCPVLGVHRSEDLREESGLRLLVPARSAESAFRVASEASRVLDRAGQSARIRLVQLVPESGSEGHELGRESAEARMERGRLDAERELETISEKLTDRGVNTTSAVVREGRAVAVARAERRDFGADVIAVRGVAWDRGGRFFRKSALAELLARARCPVLTV